MGGSVQALVREAGRIARMDGQRPFAGRAPGTARVNPDPFSDVKTDLMVDFALGEAFSAHAEEGGVPRRVQAEQLAGMNGCTPSRRGEPRSGESSRPYSQLKQKGHRETGPFVLVADNLIMPVMGVARRRSGDSAGLVWGSCVKVEINSATRNMLHSCQSFMLHVQGFMGKCIDCATCCVMVPVRESVLYSTICFKTKKCIGMVTANGFGRVS